VLELVGVLITIIAVTGVVLNNYKNCLCFKLWIFSNLLSALIHGCLGVYSLVARDLIFLYLAFDGLKRWSK